MHLKTESAVQEVVQGPSKLKFLFTNIEFLVASTEDLKPS